VLKLILSLEALSPDLTGIGRYTWELATRLPYHPQISVVEFYRNGRWVKDPGTLVNPADAVKAVPHIKFPRRLRNWQMTFACQGKLMHGPNFFLPACADIGVITVHDLSVFKFPDTHPIERVKQFERDFSRSIAKSTHVITDSVTTRAEVLEFTGLSTNQVTAIPLGVSELYRPRPPEELNESLRKYGLSLGCYALCVSTLEPRKKIDRLLSAWYQLPLILRKAFQLVLVGGNGWLSSTLQTEIALGEAQGWIKRLGYVSESDLPLLYAGATAFVYPSTYEGFGLPPIEAMASGVPVVVSNQSCIPEVTQGAGLMIDPDDQKAFSAALERCLTDAPWRQTAITKGLLVASTYTWQQCIDQTAALYQQVMRS
jgi:glycosyltransferase involved in cell wall biosynthesis